MATSDTDATRDATARALTKLTPLGVVAAVWIAIAVLFPTAEPASGVQATGSTADGFVAGPGGTDSEGGSVLSTGGRGPSPTPSGSVGSAIAGSGQVAGRTGGAGSTSSNLGTVATSTGTGVTVGGVDCGPGVRQIPVSQYAIPCVAAWSGDNGGATARGVSADEIVIVERTFPESANSQAVDSVNEQAGLASDAEAQAVYDVFKAYMNDMYEMYGRKVRWVTYESQYGNSTDEVQSKGREGACLDADVVAEELGAFGVIGTRGAAVTGPFAECAAERGLLVFNGAAYFPEVFMADRHPFVWGWIMECERISYQLSEYIGKRLAGRPARWAGDPLMQTQPRTFATYVPNNDEYQHCVDIHERDRKERYGVEGVSRYNYTLDVSRFPDEAARGIVQFKADGATTLVMACDPISMIFLTSSATSQAYYPEWLLLGVAGQDTDAYGQLYDQEQADGHMFGMSQLGETTKVLGKDSEPGRVYKHITGNDIVDGTAGGYPGLVHTYNLIQAAGPNLTAQSIGAGALTIPPGGGPDFAFGYWSLQDGPDGTAGVGDHTQTDDSKEVYWDGSAVSQTNGSAGTFLSTYDGRRFRNGQWPSEPPPIYPGR